MSDLAAFELAGFIAAHAAACLAADGELEALVAYQSFDGERGMVPFDGDMLEAVAAARDFLARNPREMAILCLAYAGSTELRGTTLPALQLDIRDFRLAAEAEIALAYRRDTGGRPTFLRETVSATDPDFEDWLQAGLPALLAAAAEHPEAHILLGEGASR